MGFIGSIITKAVSGVQTLVQNAKIGKQAIASGYTTSLVSQAQSQNQQTQNTSAPFGLSINTLLMIGAGIIIIVVAIVSIFKRK